MLILLFSHHLLPLLFQLASSFLFRTTGVPYPNQDASIPGWSPNSWPSSISSLPPPWLLGDIWSLSLLQQPFQGTSHSKRWILLTTIKASITFFYSRKAAFAVIFSLLPTRMAICYSPIPSPFPQILNPYHQVFPINAKLTGSCATK